jgi:Protein of unknown function (DUF2786)
MVQTAAKLLAKAQSTSSDHEAIALVERSYELLAKAINAYEVEYANSSVMARRRERRRLHERRRRSRSDAAKGSETDPRAPVRAVDSIARYRGEAGDASYSWRSGVDVVL